MSTILEADATGALRLPPSVLPNPGPSRRYRVATEAGQVVVKEILEQQVDPKARNEWLKELDERRERGRTGVSVRPSQEIWDEIRGDR